MSLPAPEAAAYLKESIPCAYFCLPRRINSLIVHVLCHSYLLGSGGTLMFDVTIVCQTMLYRPKAVLHARRNSLLGGSSEEHEALMSASTDVDVVTPRRRVAGSDGA